MAFNQLGYIILLSLIQSFVCIDVEEESVIYIKPLSISSTCPATVEFCLTLSQFAATQREFKSSTMTLKLLPGNHSLNLTLVVVNITKLSMIAISSPNFFCQCNAARFVFENIT